MASSTNVQIYNFSGTPITHRHTRVVEGSQMVATRTIANERWGTFTQGPLPQAHPSSAIAGVIYTGTNSSNTRFDCLIAWYNPHRKPSHRNKVYTEVRVHGGFDTPPDLTYIQDKLDDNNKTMHMDTRGGFWSSVSIDTGTRPALVRAIVSAPAPP